MAKGDKKKKKKEVIELTPHGTVCPVKDIKESDKMPFSR